MENTKAVVVIDMPKHCYGCDFCQFYGTSYGRVCTRTAVHVQNDGFDITKSRHETCPLKPMPEKYTDMLSYDSDTFERGWNDCIDEILY